MYYFNLKIITSQPPLFSPIGFKSPQFSLVFGVTHMPWNWSCSSWCLSLLELTIFPKPLCLCILSFHGC